jgi:ATP-dependent RNA helicase RhlE
MSFSELGLMAETLRAVEDAGYTVPTPIQEQAIPQILEGRDVMATAQTGTGKTAGFTLPLLQRLSAGAVNRPASSFRPIRTLILTPTRELAAQVEESVRVYGKYLPLKSSVIFGGVGIGPQIQMLRKGVDILVATPGRLLDHVGQRTVDLSRVEILVLDEADRMLDMGFIRDIRKVLALLPTQRQNLLFSATFSEEIRELAGGFMHSPVLIETDRRNEAAALVTQTLHPVDRERKRELLSHLIQTHDWRQCLVFTRTKHGANRLAQQLERDGITATAIHGNKSQPQRTKALADFKAGRVRILVATDIAARGLDIDQLPHVINFELPHVAEDYVHRIGRTGRAGTPGDAVSLVCVDENKLLADIERLIKGRITTRVIAGFEPDPRIAPEPIPNGRNGVRPPQPYGGSRTPAGARSGAPAHRPQHAGGYSGSTAPRPVRPVTNGNGTRTPATPTSDRVGHGSMHGTRSGHAIRRPATQPPPQK